MILEVSRITLDQAERRRVFLQHVEADPDGGKHRGRGRARIDENEQRVILSVRPEARRRQRCGRCGRPAPWFDAGRGRCRWRDLDHGVMRVFLEADAPRVDCRRHITCQCSRHRPQRPLPTGRNGRNRSHSSSVRSPFPMTRPTAQ
ncbi:transposase family protein [Streptomyces sp. NPDC001709]